MALLVVASPGVWATLAGCVRGACRFTLPCGRLQVSIVACVGCAGLSPLMEVALPDAAITMRMARSRIGDVCQRMRTYEFGSTVQRAGAERDGYTAACDPAGPA
jgi:hypothetical protein